MSCIKRQEDIGADLARKEMAEGRESGVSSVALN